MNEQRPRQIIQAIALLWLSSGLGFAGSVREVTDPAALGVSALLMLTIAVTLTVSLWRGRNWARTIYLILVLLSLTNFLAAWGTAERPPLAVALEAVSFVADAGSFFLMFTPPGSSWFQYVREPQL